MASLWGVPGKEGMGERGGGEEEEGGREEGDLITDRHLHPSIIINHVPIYPFLPPPLITHPIQSTNSLLHQLLLWPLYSYPDTYRRMKVTPPQGILLRGPSGCGKTLLAQVG